MTQPVHDWQVRPQGHTFPHHHQVEIDGEDRGADPGVDPLRLDADRGVWVPDLGWQQWTVAECDHYARRLHDLHRPQRGRRMLWRARCGCGRRIFATCPHARWVRGWLAYQHALTRSLSPHTAAPQIRRAGLEFVFRKPSTPLVWLVATCDGGVHIGADWYPVFDRDTFRSDAFHTLTTHHPLGWFRDQLAWQWPPIAARHRVCFGCALEYTPTWSITLCTRRAQARAWMHAPRWWRRCAGASCDTWPRGTPAHECGRN